MKNKNQNFYITVVAIVAIVAIVVIIMMFGLKRPLAKEIVGKGSGEFQACGADPRAGTLQCLCSWSEERAEKSCSAPFGSISPFPEESEYNDKCFELCNTYLSDSGVSDRGTGSNVCPTGGDIGNTIIDEGPEEVFCLPSPPEGWVLGATYVYVGLDKAELPDQIAGEELLPPETGGYFVQPYPEAESDSEDLSNVP